MLFFVIQFHYQFPLVPVQRLGARAVARRNTKPDQSYLKYFNKKQN